MVLTITPRTPKIGPRSSKSPPRPDLLSERVVSGFARFPPQATAKKTN